MALVPLNQFDGTLVSASNVTAATLLAPASNTNGVTIRSVSMSSIGGVYSALFLDTAAPSSEYDTTKKRWKVCGPGNDVNWDGALYVPPGIGIYFKPNAAGTNNSVHLIYKAN